MDVPAVHPSRGTVGTAHGAGAVRSNELLDGDTRSTLGLRLFVVNAGEVGKLRIGEVCGNDLCSACVVKNVVAVMCWPKAGTKMKILCAMKSLSWCCRATHAPL